MAVRSEHGAFVVTDDSKITNTMKIICKLLMITKIHLGLLFSSLEKNLNVDNDIKIRLPQNISQARSLLLLQNKLILKI